jgi:hypothetical protein
MRVHAYVRREGVQGSQASCFSGGGMHRSTFCAVPSQPTELARQLPYRRKLHQNC